MAKLRVTFTETVEYSVEIETDKTPLELEQSEEEWWDLVEEQAPEWTAFGTVTERQVQEITPSEGD